MHRRSCRFLVLWILVIAAIVLPGSSLTAIAGAQEKSDRHPASDHPHPQDFPRNAEQPEKKSPYSRLGDGEEARSFTLASAAGEERAAPTLEQSVTSGTAFLPVILVDFLDQPAERLIHKPSDYQDMLFQQGYPYGAGSMRDFYLDQSGGLLDVTGEVSPVWLPMPRTYSAYVGDKSGYQTSGPNDFTLVEDAVVFADPIMDFCKGDTNNDGFVDSLVVVHAGPGAEETGSGLWSIKWSLPTAITTGDTCDGRAVKIKDFTIAPEEFRDGTLSAPGVPPNLVSVGIFVHEFGHVLGLPDLYDTDHSSPGGVGTWDVMAGGTYGFTGRSPWRPTPLSAWPKMKLGWAAPQNVSSDSPAVAIPSADGGHTGIFQDIFRLAPGGSADATEYFLVENRSPNGWASDIPSAGLAVWHVDELSSDNSSDDRPLVALVQADGLDQLTAPGVGSAFGDAGDLLPGTVGVRGIDQQTSPSTDLYGGTDSGIAVWRVGDPGPTTVADLYVSSSSPKPPLDGSEPIVDEGSMPIEVIGPTPIVTLLPPPPSDVQPVVDTDAPVISRVSDSRDPFAPRARRGNRTVIRFALSENANISLSIHKLSGRLVVRKLRSQPLESGDSSVTWNGQNADGRLVKAGTYIYRIKAVDPSDNTATMKGSVSVLP